MGIAHGRTAASTAGIGILGALVIAVAAPDSAGRSAENQSPPSDSPCRIDGTPVRVADLREGSGVAASRARPGTLWAHNDSTRPELVVLDEQGAVTGRVRVTGAGIDDWEDIAVGPCPRGSCIYIGDIGDNNGSRSQVTVYRVPEPAGAETATQPAEAFHAKYPDGAHDAESLFVADGPTIFIVTKGDPGPVALYRFPKSLQAGKTVTLERVAAPIMAKADAKDRPTSADLSRDGRWVAVRTTAYAAFYPAADLTAGRWTIAHRIDLGPLREPRGEGIAFGREGMVFLVGEAGTSGGTGTFARLRCTF